MYTKQSFLTTIKALLLISFGSLLIFGCVNTPKTTPKENFTVQLLGINDFHGQVLPLKDRGGMYNLSHHLLGAIESTNDASFILHGGDHVGASPAESALLQDEPAIDFLNIISTHCQVHRDNTCHIIGTAGNHEFDEGSEEMLRLLTGGNHAKGPFIHTPWKGANYKTLSANVVYEDSQELLLEPYVIHKVNGVDIGFIGITLDITPRLVVPGIVGDLEFKNQADIVNEYTNLLQQQGIESIVVIVHDGTRADYYEGPTKVNSTIPLDSKFGQFLQALPNAVDVVVTGHSHRFTNAYFEKPNGEKMLVTQSFANGRAYADITVTINPQTKDIVASSAEIIITKPENIRGQLSAKASDTLLQIRELIQQSSEYTQKITQQVINTYQPIDDEISLGNFIADAHKFILKTDVAVMNRGGVRAALLAGDVTWGQLFAIQPFDNALIVRRYTGEQLLDLIARGNYWSKEIVIKNDEKITLNGTAIDKNKTYTVGGNSYLMNGKAHSIGELVSTHGQDIDALVDYIRLLPTPFNLLDSPE